MSEAWNLDQQKAAGIAPELTAQHEPGPMCGDMHCHIHHVDEIAGGAYRVCGECGHVYRTAEDLQREWAENAPPDLPDRTVPPVEQIHFCPLCAHDW